MPHATRDLPETDEALDALNAEQMRSLIRALMPWFDDRLYARFVNAAIDHATRGRSGWLPDPPGAAVVGDIERFAAASRRAGYADPAYVDAYLRAGSNALLARDYAAAYRIFHALLVPLAHAASHG
jgi:hypothetical protein